jgi:hypothetical protein
VLVVPIGIPVLFLLVIAYKDHPLLKIPSRLLHENFEVEWQYFEVYDLIRKLLLTSLVVFVSMPNSASRCLYLLIIDTSALVILAYSRPYANENDDFLSSSLVTVECVSFLVALIVLSNINEDDGWGSLAMMNVLFFVTIFALFVIVPCTLAMKFKSVSRRVNYVFDRFNNAIAGAGIKLPSLHRLDSRRRVVEDLEEIRMSMDMLKNESMYGRNVADLDFEDSTATSFVSKSRGATIENPIIELEMSEFE